MKTELSDLINSYEQARNTCIAEFRESCSHDGEDAHSEGTLPLSGVTFELHGIGCRFETPQGAVVEYDAGPNGRLGFNAWQLECFAASSEGARFMTMADIDHELKEAEQNGELEKGSGPFSHLYFPSRGTSGSS